MFTPLQEIRSVSREEDQESFGWFESRPTEKCQRFPSVLPGLIKPRVILFMGQRRKTLGHNRNQMAAPHWPRQINDNIYYCCYYFYCYYHSVVATDVCASCLSLSVSFLDGCWLVGRRCANSMETVSGTVAHAHTQDQDVNGQSFSLNTQCDR